ncbi:MAG TPA: M20/M25/M40 family metallo-hydrolase [Vicinamibacterales bacterium]|jgi:carboxypeptidase Q|nr:M20/M25/M40 family metallo-hydrolase [Vicinamibacterales bacterium]
MKASRLLIAAISVAAITTPLVADEAVNLDVVHNIRDEALQNSQVMDHLFYLTDVSGSRLTNSPGFFNAADWVVKRLGEWGISAHQEKWGPYGRGWTYTRFSAQMLEPQSVPLIGAPLAYTPGTNGPVTGEPIIIAINNEGDFNKYKGTLKGKIVLLGPGRDLQMSLQPLGSRRTDADLATLAQAPEAGPGRGQAAPGAAAIGGGRQGGPGGGNANQQFQRALNKFLSDEGAAVVVRPAGGRSEGGTLFAQGGGTRDPKDPVPPPMVVLTPEHYNRIARLLDHKVPVKLEFNVDARFVDDRMDSVNVIGEIPGGRKRAEIVMIGAHLDSWHTGTGATDNAAGSAVMIEVMRILKTLNLRLDRTVRLALWSGEEQGILGSRAYVTEHFAAREDMKLKPEHAKLSGYFNVDNGSGKIRGVYLQGNDAMRPIFEAWLKPFEDLGATTISIRNTGGTDHLSFDAVGLPGFQFIQDPLEYDSRTHHSNMDVYDRVQRADMMQMAAIVASIVYNAANRDELLPRKPLPKPQPAPQQPPNANPPTR